MFTPRFCTGWPVRPPADGPVVHAGVTGCHHLSLRCAGRGGAGGTQRAGRAGRRSADQISQGSGREGRVTPSLSPNASGKVVSSPRYSSARRRRVPLSSCRSAISTGPRNSHRSMGSLARRTWCPQPLALAVDQRFHRAHEQLLHGDKGAACSQAGGSVLRQAGVKAAVQGAVGVQAGRQCSVHRGVRRCGRFHGRCEVWKPGHPGC